MKSTKKIRMVTFLELQSFNNEIHQNYALINRARGPYEKIFVLAFKAYAVRSMRPEQIFPVRTEISVNKIFIVYQHK